MTAAYLRSTRGNITFDLPAAWRTLTMAEFEAHDQRPDPTILTANALAQPVGAPPLDLSLTPHSRVVVLVEDLTRKSPKKTILKYLLSTLEGLGIARRNIAIVMSLGTHQGLSSDDFEKAFGKAMARDYTFFNHDCRAADLVPVGRLDSGAEVKINRRVYDADFRIGIGSIFPHPMNGFGGGGKILFPGVADLDSIFEHHLNHSFRGGACLGKTDDNAFHAEVCRLALAGGLDFIINSILDHEDRLYDVVSGHPIEAHRSGIDICKSIISQSFRGPSDITLISAFPYTEGPQIMKPLAPAGIITRKGGTIILHADCSSPLPEIYFDAAESFRTRYPDRIGPAVLDHFAHQRPIIPDGPPELNMSLAQCLLGIHDFHIILVSRDIPAALAKRLGFTHAQSIDAAIEILDDRDTAPTVNIVPSGGVILPLIAETTG